MANKHLSFTQCNNRLEKAFRARFTEEELERAEFYPDGDGDLEYTWRFVIDGNDHHLTCDRIDGTVTYANY